MRQGSLPMMKSVEGPTLTTGPGSKMGLVSGGLAVGISSRLQLIMVEVTVVDQCIMPVRVKHTLGLISLVVVYSPTEVCEAAKKDAFYNMLNSLLDWCPLHLIFLVTLMPLLALIELGLSYLLFSMDLV